MTTRTIERAVWTSAVPEAVSALSGLPTIDYADRFTLATEAVADPVRWARAMFGDVPSAGEILIWRGVLHLRLDHTRSPSTVAGWRIGGRGDGWLRLEAASWFLSANLVVRASGGRVTLMTFMHYARPPAGVLWPALSAVHRRLAPGVIRSADARILERC